MLAERPSVWVIDVEINGPVSVLVLMSAVTKHRRLVSFYHLEHWVELEDEVHYHTDCVKQLDEIREEAVVQVHQDNFLKLISVSHHTNDAQECLNEPDVKHSSIQISHEEVFVFCVRVKPRDHRGPFKRNLDLAEAV